MADKKFDLGDYVEVKDRIKLFYELFGQGRLVTSGYELTKEPDDKPKVIVTAYAYRTTDDPHPGVGTSWMYLPGTTSYTRGSEIENVETSAWGRAIGALGILIDKSIATSTEIEAKSGETAPQHLASPAPERAIRADEPEPLGPWSGSGVIQVNKKAPADGFIRNDPDDGKVLVVKFTTTDEKNIPQVVFRGALAADLYDASSGQLDGLVCTLEGDLFRVPWFKEKKPMPPYQRLEVHRIQTAGWTLPAPAVADGSLVSDPLVRAGAPSPDEEAELDALALNL